MHGGAIILMSVLPLLPLLPLCTPTGGFEQCADPRAAEASVAMADGLKPQTALLVSVIFILARLKIYKPRHCHSVH